MKKMKTEGYFIKCPCCGSAEIESSEPIADKEGNITEILTCKKCGFKSRETVDSFEREVWLLKKIINGRLYDTEKSEKLCEYVEYNLLFGKINFVLYKTKKGRFFASKNNPIPGYFEASEEFVKKALAKQNPDKYIELFGEAEEG